MLSREQLRSIANQLPKGEEIVRYYVALEGDTRVITRDCKGREKRYTVLFDGVSVSIKEK